MRNLKNVTLNLAEDSHLGKAGQRVTLALQPSDVHDPTELATYLAGYKNYQYRADSASKIILVDNPSDKYRTFNSNDAFRRTDVKGSTSGDVPEIDPESSLATYSCVERFVGSFIPAQTENQTGNAYDPVMKATRKCTNAIMLDRELDVFSSTGLLGTATNFDATVRITLLAGENWNGGSNADPIKNLQTLVENSIQPVHGFWMNQKVANAFLRNDSVRDHMRQFYGDSQPQAAIGRVNFADGQDTDFQIIGLPPIHVSAAKVRNETTGAKEYVLGDYVIGVTQPMSVPVDGEEVATSYTFRWSGPSGTGFEVRQYQLDNRGPLGGTMVVVYMSDIAVMTANETGGHIANVIA
jgi:hypothetical protein